MNPLRTPRQKLIAALLAALAAFVGYLIQAEKEPEPTPVGSTNEPGVRSFGWVRDPAAVAAVKATLPCPDFRSTEAYRTGRDGPDDVYLWNACRQATGSLLPPRDQGQVGACVGFGTASAIEHLLCLQIAAGRSESYRDLAPEAIYAGSRVEIGGGRISGDGSVGAWAARFVREYGVLPRDRYPDVDLTRYDERRCRELGRVGLTPGLERQARQHPVKAVAAVRSWDEARAAIRNGYPIAVCSSQGFQMQRDADGFCRAEGVWMHCMALVGIRGGRRPGGFLLNSWGADAHTGPRGVGDPSPAGFWVEARVLDRMLAEGDSWAFSEAVGFPGRRLDWYLLAGADPSHS